MNGRDIAVWLVKIGLAIVILLVGHHWLVEVQQAYAAGDPYAVIEGFFKILLVGGLVIAIFFFNIVHGVGDRMARFLMPEVANTEIRPEYSLAEARAREGRYEEAIAEFRKVWEKFPNDVTAHVRIAEILCAHFQRYDEAVRELRAALEKQSKPERWAFLANRLVDVQVEHLHDFVGARATLQQVMLKLPGSKHAEAARARVEALNEKEKRESLPDRPRLRVPDSDEG